MSSETMSGEFIRNGCQKSCWVVVYMQLIVYYIVMYNLKLSELTFIISSLYVKLF